MHRTKHRRGNRSLTNPLFQVCGLTWGGSGQDTRVSEACLEQAADDKEEEDGCNDGDGQGEVTGKEGAAVKRKKKIALLPTITTELALSCDTTHYELSQGSGLKRCCFAETSGTARASPENTGVALGRQDLRHRDGSTRPCTQPLCLSEVPELRFKNLTAAPKLDHPLKQQHQEHMEKHPKLKQGSKSA